MSRKVAAVERRRADVGREIGTYFDRDVNANKIVARRTSVAVVHKGPKGAHVVPSRPMDESGTDGHASGDPVVTRLELMNFALFRFLGEITPDIRLLKITCDDAGKAVEFTAWVEDPPLPDTVENIQCIATEILADLPFGTSWQDIIEVSNGDMMGEISERWGVFYLRREAKS